MRGTISHVKRLRLWDVLAISLIVLCAAAGTLWVSTRWVLYSASLTNPSLTLNIDSTSSGGIAIGGSNWGAEHRWEFSSIPASDVNHDDVLLLSAYEDWHWMGFYFYADNVNSGGIQHSGYAPPIIRTRFLV